MYLFVQFKFSVSSHKHTNRRTYTHTSLPECSPASVGGARSGSPQIFIAMIIVIVHNTAQYDQRGVVTIETEKWGHLQSFQIPSSSQETPQKHAST